MPYTKVDIKEVEGENTLITVDVPLYLLDDLNSFLEILGGAEALDQEGGKIQLILEKQEGSDAVPFVLMAVKDPVAEIRQQNREKAQAEAEERAEQIADEMTAARGLH